MQKLLDVAGDESLSTTNRKLALVKLIQQYPSIFKQYKTEIEMLSHIRDIKNEINILDGKASISNPKNEVNRIDKRLKELDRLSKTKRYQEGYGIDEMGQKEMGYYAKLTKKEEAEKIALLKQKESLKRQIKKDDANTYLTNLTGVSNQSLERQIKERKNLLAKMDLDKKSMGKQELVVLMVSLIGTSYKAKSNC